MNWNLAASSFALNYSHMNIFVTLVLIASTDGIKVIYLQLLGFIKKMKVKWQAEVTTLGLLVCVITDHQ